MKKQIGMFGLFLVVLIYCVSVVNAAEAMAGTSIDSSNKFLSAETQRVIDAKTDEMLQEMQDYQDENFRIFDGRMQALVDDMKMKVIIGGLGVILLGMGITSYVMLKYFKKYSYEEFLEEQLKKAGTVQQEGQYDASGVEQMQQTAWYPQQPQQTIGMAKGQEWASDMTQMNQWQAQPAYDGAWQSPVETTPEQQYPVQQQQQQQQSEQYPAQDPMQSPGWTPEY